MKKIILIITILMLTSIISQAQDTCSKYVIHNFRKANQRVDTIWYLCDTVKKPSGQSNRDFTDSTYFKRYIEIYNELTKAMKETKDLDEYKALQAQINLVLFLIREEELKFKKIWNIK